MPEDVKQSALEVNTVDATEGQKTQAAQEIEKDPAVPAKKRTAAKAKDNEPADQAVNGGIAKDVRAIDAHAATLQELSDARRANQLNGTQG